MNNRLKILSAAAIAIFTSCGGNKGAESMEKGESAMAVVEAAMMEGGPWPEETASIWGERLGR